MYNLTDLPSYKAYFEALATAHIGIDGFLFGDEETRNNDVRYWAGKKLWLEQPARVKLIGPNNDNVLKRKTCSLWVGGAAPSELYQDEQTYYTVCEKIVEDIISRLDKDYRDQTIITKIETDLEYGRADVHLSTKLVGCRLDFYYIDPTGFVYNQAQWQ